MTPKKHLITIVNDFHHTSARLFVGEPNRYRDIEITTRQERRAWNALCGIADCTCSGPAGQRARGDRYVSIQAVN